MRNDLNLDLELKDLLFTDKDTDAISRPVIWTEFRRKTDNTKVNCSGCNPDNLGYVEGQLGCPYCQGAGYLWDQKLIEGYVYKANENKDRYNLGMVSSAGKADSTSFVLITPFDIRPQIEDTISIPRLDEYGRLAIPLFIEDKQRVIYSRSTRASKSQDYFITYLGG